jgi:hypothetical protein
MLGSSWVAAQLAASQEGLSFMKLVKILARRDLLGELVINCKLLKFLQFKDANLSGHICSSMS